MKNMTSIIILSYNTLEMTRMCLESIRAHTPEEYELILVDNASTDGSREYLRKQPDVRLIENTENLGFPKGCNQGLEIARGDSLLLLNSDTVVTRNWLTNLKKGLYSEKNVGAVGCLANYVYNDQQIQVTYGEDMEAMQAFAAGFNRSDPAKWEERPHLVGFCYLFKREVYEAVGGLDEAFTPGNFEDNDYSLRILEQGYRLLLLKDTFIHHWGSGSFRKMEADSKEGREKSRFYMELSRRNMQKFFEKWQVPYAYIHMKPAKVRALIQKQAGLPWPVPVRQKRLASMAIFQTGVKGAELWRAVNDSDLGEVCYIVDDAHVGRLCSLQPGVDALTVSWGMAKELYRYGALDGFACLSPTGEETGHIEKLEEAGVSRQHLLVAEAAKKVPACLSKADFGKRAALLSPSLDNSAASRALLGAAKALKADGWKAVLYAPQGGPLEQEFDELGIQVILDERVTKRDFSELQWTQQYDLLLVNTLSFAPSFHSREPFPPLIWWIHEGGFDLPRYPALAGVATDIGAYDATGVTTVPISHAAADAVREFAPNWPLSENVPFDAEEIPRLAASVRTLSSK